MFSMEMLHNLVQTALKLDEPTKVFGPVSAEFETGLDLERSTNRKAEHKASKQRVLKYQNHQLLRTKSLGQIQL